MKKKIFFIKSIISLLIAATVYLSYNYNIPYKFIVKNEVTYYINHSSDIKYIANNAWRNAKAFIQIMAERAGE